MVPKSMLARGAAFNCSGLMAFSACTFDMSPEVVLRMVLQRKNSCCSWASSSLALLRAPSFGQMALMALSADCSFSVSV